MSIWEDEPAEDARPKLYWHYAWAIRVVARGREKSSYFLSERSLNRSDCALCRSRSLKATEITGIVSQAVPQNITTTWASPRICHVTCGRHRVSEVGYYWFPIPRALFQGA